MVDKLSKWIKETKKNLKEIKEMKPEDRLETLAHIQLCNESIYASVIGWDSFIKRPKVMYHFNDKELEELFNQFKEIAIKFLGADLKATKKVKALMPKEERRESGLTYIG